MADLAETRIAVRELVLKSTIFNADQFQEMMLEHQIYIQNGGAGGSWETFYIQNLIFGSYKGPKINAGKQMKINFRNVQDLDLRSITLIYADCASLLGLEKNWENADLEGSLFIDSLLNGSSFKNADLCAADFSRSEMRGCNFQGANLIKTDFENCDLSNADFSNARIDKSTSFKNAILENAKFD